MYNNIRERLKSYFETGDKPTQEQFAEFISNSLYSIENILYQDLVSLRNNSSLIPGQFYRILNYITTTTQADTQSAGHPFDVIVLALSDSELSEQAWAVQSARDTDGHFANSKLSAWQIWYCLDNDTSRFAWADAENGKGVIYRMIDEWNNDCPYDFKNIQYSHNGVWLYTFGNDLTGQSYSNTIATYISNQSQRLNRIIFGNNCHSNSFGNDCYSNTFGKNCHSNSFGKNCHSNSFGNDCRFNSFSDNCYSNSFSDNCYSNSFGNSCYSNTFGKNCRSSSFGNYCYSNSFNNGCYSNSFGNSCYSNSFGSSCYSNSFGNRCYSNSFGSSCYSNSFGNRCYSNSFDHYCRYNHLDDGVSVILFNIQTASSNQQVQNYHLTQGLTGKTIKVERNRVYQTTVSVDSSGNVKQFCIADLA